MCLSCITAALGLLLSCVLGEQRNQLLQNLTGLVFTVTSITLIKYTASLCIKSLLITNPLEVTIILCILYFTLMYCKGVSLIWDDNV